MDERASREEQIPERFDPASQAGELAEAEHLARYRCAARLAGGRRVLDSGCGTAYGTAMLARAGATETVGVDVAPAVIEAARAEAPPDVDLRVGDVTALDFEADYFDLVVCLEVIEHLEERDRALDELARVLAPGGVLLVSSPNRDVYVPGNPHHVHEYRPEELREALGRHLANVELRRQHDWIVSAVLDDAAMVTDDAETSVDARFAKVVAVQPGDETYTLAIASDGELPVMPNELVATGTVELRRWLELWNEQHEVLRRQHQHFENQKDSLDEMHDLRLQLLASESEVARIAELETDRRLAIAEVARLNERLEEETARVEALHRDLDTLAGSTSWRMTEPLRKLKRRAGR
jgi:SAM-dependent methyltransferase